MYFATATFVLSIALAAAARAEDKAVAGWSPVFRDANTIKVVIHRTRRGRALVKLVDSMIDGQQPYVLLGDRAYGRSQKNSTSPYVNLKAVD